MAEFEPKIYDGSPVERLILFRLDAIEESLGDVRAEVVGVRIDVATLKVKAGIWGAAAGTVPAIVTGLMVFLGGPGIT